MYCSHKTNDTESLRLGTTNHSSLQDRRRCKGIDKSTKQSLTKSFGTVAGVCQTVQNQCSWAQSDLLIVTESAFGRDEIQLTQTWQTCGTLLRSSTEDVEYCLTFVPIAWFSCNTVTRKQYGPAGDNWDDTVRLSDALIRGANRQDWERGVNYCLVSCWWECAGTWNE